MAIQTKTMVVKSDTALAETKTTIRDTVTFDTSKLPNGITYKGLKAVLSFADPIQWNKASTYDSLTVVWDGATHASYASKRPVPQNIELTNEFYWLRTADLDAQVEIYRQEVQQFDGRITANAQAIAAETARAEAAEQALQGNIDKSVEVPIENFQNINAALSYGAANNVLLTAKTLTVEESIKLQSNVNMYIDELTYTGNNSAVILDSVNNVNLRIGTLNAPNGNGIAFDCKTKTCSLNNIVVGTVNAGINGIDFTTSSTLTTTGVMECSVKGTCINAVNGINIKSDGGWVGQLKLLFNAIKCSGFAINIIPTNNGVNGLYFGYTSFEDSTNGININLQNARVSCENIIGSFRVSEVPNKALTVSGSLNKFSQPPVLTFDKISNNRIDVTGITQTSYSYGYIVIRGMIIESNSAFITYEGVIANNKGISPVKKPMQTVTVTDKFDNNSYNNVYVNAGTVTVNIPNWVNAMSDSFIIECGANVTINLNNANGTPIGTYTDTSEFIIVVKGQYSGNNNYLITKLASKNRA